MQLGAVRQGSALGGGANMSYPSVGTGRVPSSEELGVSLEILGTEILRKLETMIDTKVGQLDYATKNGPSDIVTEADRLIESWLWEWVHNTYPDDGFLGEEHGWRFGPTGGRDWVVDPIDGTANFACGIPWACCSVGVLIGGAAEAGIIVDPFRREIYRTTGEKVSLLNGKAVRVSEGASLAGRVVLAEVPTGMPLTELGSVTRAVVEGGGSARAMGSGALAMALVAAGRAHAVVHAGPSVWDVAAGVALVKHAGGIVIGPAGAYVPSVGGPLIAGNAEVCEVLRGVLAGSSAN